MRAEVTYPAALESVTRARRFVEHWLTLWSCDALSADAVLLVSEMVSNAVLHAGTDISVILDLDDDRLRIEVEDGRSELPVPREVSTDATSGRGFTIIDRLADRWGAAPVSGGKVVWCELSPSVS